MLLWSAAGLNNVGTSQLLLNTGKIRDDDITEAVYQACERGSLKAAQVCANYAKLDLYSVYNLLLVACRGGRVAVVTWLLRDIMKMLPTNSNYVKWLVACYSAHGDIDTVKRLITETRHYDVGAASLVLRMASFNAKLDVIDWLINNTAADLSRPGDIGRLKGLHTTPLTAAATAGHWSAVRALLPHTTPEAVNMECGWKKNTALHLTIWTRFINVDNENIQAIISASGCGNINDDYHALLIACAHGKIDIVSDLIYTCLEVVDWQDNNGRTPLHQACMGGHVDVVRALLSVFPRTDIAAESGHTAAELAEFNGYVNIPPCFQNSLITTVDETAITETSATETRVTETVVVEIALAENAFAETAATDITTAAETART